MSAIFKKLSAATLVLGLLCSFALTSEKIPVFVSILPQKFFTEQIGGDHFKVDVLVPPGKEPHDYAPTTLQMTNLARAKALFAIGVPFEKTLLPKIQGALKNLKIINTAKGVELIAMSVERDHENEAVGNHKGEKEDHGHEAGGLDPHIWLDPLRAVIIAQNIRDGLIEIDPANKVVYETNFTILKGKLEKLNAGLAKSLAPFKGKTVFVFHPAFGYFCNRYGLIQEAVEVDGKSPSPAQLANLIKEAREDKVQVIFLQPQFNPNAARAIAQAINGAVVQLDPLAENYITNLQRIAEVIGTYFG